MATPIRQLRGTAAENDAYVGASGVITIDETNQDIRVHDGVTPGGKPIRSGGLGPLATLFGGNEGQVVGIVDDVPAYVDPIGFYEGAFTPSVSFATPGDLAVTYARQVGRVQRIGNWVRFHVDISFTPTFTTASGNFIISGLPYTAENVGSGFAASISSVANFKFDFGKLELTARVNAGSSDIVLVFTRSEIFGILVTSSSVNTEISYSLMIGGEYVLG